jgi:acetyltransferase-like isoleucine patch superfamily enzyme
VWIDEYTIVIAGKTDLSEGRVKKVENKNYKSSEGKLAIGDGVHIGSFNVIQAHAGVSIGNFVTTSSGVKIYSLSNYPFNEEDPEEITYANSLVGSNKAVSYVHSPIVIEDGVWLGLNCSVVGGTIGKNSFVVSNSLVINDLPHNSYAAGNPSVKIKERFRKK